MEIFSKLSEGKSHTCWTVAGACVSIAVAYAIAACCAVPRAQGKRCGNCGKVGRQCSQAPIPDGMLASDCNGRPWNGVYDLACVLNVLEACPVLEIIL